MGNVAGVRTSLGVSGMPFYFESLNYPAAPPPHLEDSVNLGVSRLSAEVNYVNQTCPYAPIVLIGHSQGAMVVSHLLTGATVPALTTSAKNNIRAVALFGDPQYRTGMLTNFVNQPNNGLLSQSLTFPKSSLASYRYWGWPYGATTAEGWVYKVREYCLAGDFFCQSNPNDSSYAIHNSYGQFAGGVAGWIQFLLTDSN
ncbi:cutinase family protein [Microbacterium sp. Se5.02b]|nr:cutinase family protein [Microbacterium sp. Se63.02b]QYM64310.1 cutinase family protein [Microbacterium sp. Se5.02b]